MGSTDGLESNSIKNSSQWVCEHILVHILESANGFSHIPRTPKKLKPIELEAFWEEVFIKDRTRLWLILLYHVFESW